MGVTLDMIAEKQFKEVSRGYDRDEVDAFLDEIMDEMESQQNEIQSLQQQLKVEKARAIPTAAPTQVVRPVTAAPAVPAPTADATNAFREILEMAQRVKDETIAKAKEEAEQIRLHAQDEVESKLGSLTEERDRLTAEVENLKNSASDFKQRFSALLKEQQDILNKSDGLF